VREAQTARQSLGLEPECSVCARVFKKVIKHFEEILF